MDILITWMTERGIPITRERYLNLAYPEGEPDPWTAEDEMMLPLAFRWIDFVTE